MNAGPAFVATVCRGCPAGRAGFAAVLRDAFAGAGIDCAVEETDCMSGCGRASTLAFRAQGKMAYLFGETGPDDIGDILAFAAHYAATADGVIIDTRPLGAFRHKAIARIPA